MVTDGGSDLVVIGGGPGGYPAAFLAADMGMKVTLIDDAPNPGGVCLYRGCIPSKALLHVAAQLEEAKHAEEWGVSYGDPAIDLDKLREWKQGVVNRLTGGLGQLTKQHGVEFVSGRARFNGARSVEVTSAEGEPRTIGFEYAIVATGSVPATIPSLELDSPLVLDSTSALELERVPETLLVIGGGYIGLELGSVYAALGSRVTVVEMTNGLLPGVDRDLVRTLQRRLRRNFEAIRLETTVLSMEEAEGGVLARLGGTDGEPSDELFEQVLVAVGRRPNSGGLGLEQTAAQLDARGFVEVDAQRRSADPAIFAIGDVAGEPMLAHKAHARGLGRRRGDRREAAGLGRARHSRGGLHGPGDRLGRPDGDRGRGPADRGPDLDAAVGRLRSRDDARPHGRRDEAGGRAAHRPRARRGHRRRGGGRPDLGGRAGDRDGGRGAGPRADDPPAPDAGRDADERRRRLLRPQPGLHRAAARPRERLTAMDLEFAFLSDFAEESGGKLHALGIGIDTIHAAEAPTRHPLLTMVAQIRYSVAEAGTHRLEVGGYDADGQQIIDRIEGEMRLPPVSGTSGTARVLVNLVGVNFPTYGDHSFHLVLNGVEVSRASVRVAPPPGG